MDRVHLRAPINPKIDLRKIDFLRHWYVSLSNYGPLTLIRTMMERDQVTNEFGNVSIPDGSCFYCYPLFSNCYNACGNPIKICKCYELLKDYSSVITNARILNTFCLTIFKEKLDEETISAICKHFSRGDNINLLNCLVRNFGYFEQLPYVLDVIKRANLGLLPHTPYGWSDVCETYGKNLDKLVWCLYDAQMFDLYSSGAYEVFFHGNGENKYYCIDDFLKEFEKRAREEYNTASRQHKQITEPERKYNIIRLASVIWNDAKIEECYKWNHDGTPTMHNPAWHIPKDFLDNTEEILFETIKTVLKMDEALEYNQNEWNLFVWRYIQFIDRTHQYYLATAEIDHIDIDSQSVNILMFPPNVILKKRLEMWKTFFSRNSNGKKTLEKYQTLSQEVKKLLEEVFRSTGNI